MINLSLLENVLKTQYVPKLNDLFKLDNSLYNFLPKHGSTIRGDGLIMPAKLTPDVSGAPRAGMGAIPGAGSPSWDRFRLWGTYYSGRFLVWEEAQDYADGVGSYVNAMQEAVDGVMESMKHMLARDMFWGRQMGLAQATTAGHVAGTLATLNAYGGVGGGVSLLGEARGARYLIKGMHFNVVDGTAPGAGVTKRAEAVTGYTEFVVTDVTTIDTIAYACIDATGAVVAATQVIAALADNDVLTPVDAFNTPTAGAKQTDPIGYQTFGFDEIVSDGTDVDSIMFGDYGGLDRSVVTETKSLVQNIGGPLTMNPDHIRRMFKALEAKSGKSSSAVDMICHDSLLEVMPLITATGTQYQPQSVPLGTPDSAISWNSGNEQKKFRTSNQCPNGTIYFINRDHMHRFELRPIGFDTNGGGMLKNYAVGGKDYPAVTGWLNWGGQIFSDCPNAHAKMVNITGPDDLYGFGSSFTYLR